MVFDLQNSSWSEVAPRENQTWPSGRYGHSALVNRDTMVVFGGIRIVGETGREMTNELWEFDLETLTWNLVNFSRTALKPFPTSWHGAVMQNEDEMLLFGGEQAYPSKNWIFNDLGDLVHQGHSEMWSMNLTETERSWKFLPFAGPEYGTVRTMINSSIMTLESGQLYNFRSGRWDAVGPQTEDSYGGDILAINSTMLCCFGGFKSIKGISNDLECIDAVNLTNWTTVALSGERIGNQIPVLPPIGRYDFTSVAVDSKAYIFGGRSSSGTLNDLHVYELR